jgi:hypothetical protein
MAKSISLVGSEVKAVTVDRMDGVTTVTVVGESVDADGNVYATKNLVLDWGLLSPQVQNTGETFLKHMSREFNKLVADEDSETW